MDENEQASLVISRRFFFSDQIARFLMSRGLELILYPIENYVVLITCLWWEELHWEEPQNQLAISITLCKTINQACPANYSHLLWKRILLTIFLFVLNERTLNFFFSFCSIFLLVLEIFYVLRYFSKFHFVKFFAIVHQPLILLQKPISWYTGRRAIHQETCPMKTVL